MSYKVDALTFPPQLAILRLHLGFIVKPLQYGSRMYMHMFVKHSAGANIIQINIIIESWLRLQVNTIKPKRVDLTTLC